MSRHHYAHSNELNQINHDREVMPKDEFEATYGVELNEDESVYDMVINKTYSSFGEWAAAQIEEEEEDEYGHTQQVSKKYEDL